MIVSKIYLDSFSVVYWSRHKEYVGFLSKPCIVISVKRSSHLAFKWLREFTHMIYDPGSTSVTKRKVCRL